MKANKISVGSVHGRFQPLHNQHLEYILEAKKCCDFLWIGITQYDIKRLQSSPNSPHREEAFNNPLTYFERITVLRESLTERGIKDNEYSFIPFPIDYPASLPDFLPIDIPIFTTICDSWNQHKIKILEELGYRVMVLFERQQNVIRGEELRVEIVNDILEWKKKVPQSSVLAVKKLKIKQRLRNLIPNETDTRSKNKN